ncbi:MAG: hypothetical protein ACRDCT_15090 [Shewanella sp.]
MNKQAKARIRSLIDKKGYAISDYATALTLAVSNKELIENKLVALDLATHKAACSNAALIGLFACALTFKQRGKTLLMDESDLTTLGGAVISNKNRIAALSLQLSVADVDVLSGIHDAACAAVKAFRTHTYVFRNKDASASAYDVLSMANKLFELSELVDQLTRRD